MTILEFVKAYYKYAKASQDKTGIDARFTLAQAALETGWGKSTPGNMFFGIKASKDTPENQKQLIKTTEIFKDDKHGYRFPKVVSITKREDGRFLYVVYDYFRKYDTPEGSFNDHNKFFLTNKRYAHALTVKHDPYKFAEEIAAAGYATGVNYANSLKKLITSIDGIIKKHNIS